MKDLYSFQQDVLRHPVCRLEIPHTCALGLPWLSLINHLLHISYFPCKSVCHGTKILLYRPQFAVTFLYPAGKLLTFSNLLTDVVADLSHPVSEIDYGEYIEKSNALWRKAEDAVRDWTQAGMADTVKVYQTLFRQYAEELGTSAPYKL